MLDIAEHDIPLLSEKEEEDDRLNTINKIIDEYRKFRN